MNPIQSRLQAHTPLILDGALATELERKGCDLNDSLWSAKILIEQPELIQQVHLDYFQAGADCATTACYQTTIDGFAEKAIQKEEAIEPHETICHFSERCTRSFGRMKRVS